MSSSEQEVIRYQKLYRQVLLERNQFKQQCNQAIRQWDQTLRERNEYRETMLKVQRQHEDAMKEVNHSMSARMKAGQDVKRIAEERNAAVQEYKLVMSERDSVHTEIEKLQEKVDAREARISQLEKKTKEHEGERQRMQFQVEVLSRGREKAESEVDSLRVKLEQRTNSCERCSTCDEAKRGAEVQQHYEASLDLGPTSASPRGRGHGLTLNLGVYVADVERDSVADGVIGVGDRVVKVNGHSLERMKDVSSAAKMLNELKDQSDASAPGSVPLSSSAAEGATQLVLILSRGAAVPAEGPPGNDGNASRAENVETKQLPRELQKLSVSEAAKSSSFAEKDCTEQPSKDDDILVPDATPTPTPGLPADDAPPTHPSGGSSSAGSGTRSGGGKKKKKPRDHRGKCEEGSRTASTAFGGGTWPRTRCGGPVVEQRTGTILHPQKVKRDRLPLAELLDNVQTPKKTSAEDKAAGEGVRVVYRSSERGNSATLERPSKSQRPATTHELLLVLDDAAASAEAAGATAKGDGGTAVLPCKGEAERPKFKQPLTVAGCIDSSCSSLLVSPPPPMRVLPSGGQSSAYAALKAMNAGDLGADGPSGALLIRTDKKGPEAVNCSSKYFALFPAAATASQGLSSLPPQSTAERHPAAAVGPLSLDSKVVTTEVFRTPAQQQPPPLYPPMMSTSGIHTPPGHMLVPPDLTLPKPTGHPPHPLILSGHAFLDQVQIHPGSITTSVVTPSGSNCGHFTHMNFSRDHHHEPASSSRRGGRSRRGTADASDDGGGDIDDAAARAPVPRGHRHHHRPHASGLATFPRKRRERDGARRSPVSGGTLPTASRHHHRSIHGGEGGGGGNSKRHYSTSSGTDRDRSLRGAASKRNSTKNSSRTAREKQIMTTRGDSSDSSDECAAGAGAAGTAGRTKQHYSETLSRRRNSKDHLLKKSSVAAAAAQSRDGSGRECGGRGGGESSPRERSNRGSGDSPRPRSNSSGKDKSSAGAEAAAAAARTVGSKSPSPRRDKTKTKKENGAPPLPPKGVKKGAAGNNHVEQCTMIEAAANKPQSSATAATTTTTSSFFKDELDFTSSRLESETNKMRFIEEIHRRQERERLHHQQQDRLARELTTTFKLTAGKRLTAKAREMSKSQGDGIDDVSEGSEQSHRKKSASRENIYDEVSVKAKGGQPNPTSAHSEQGQQETRGASAAASANSAAAKANPQLDFSDSGSIPVRMEVMPAQRMIDPPDLFNTKSREKPLPSPPIRTSSHEVTRKLLYTEVKSGRPSLEASLPPPQPPSSATSSSYHHRQHHPHPHHPHPHHVFHHGSHATPPVSNGSSGGRHHHRSHRSKRIRNRSLEMVLDERSPPCCQPFDAAMGSGSSARSNSPRNVSYSRSLERPKHRKSDARISSRMIPTE